LNYLKDVKVINGKDLSKETVELQIKKFETTINKLIYICDDSAYPV